MKQQTQDATPSTELKSELFTVGEWKVKPCYGLKYDKEILGYNIVMNGQLVAQTHTSLTMTVQEAKANAALIAQSKNMYMGIKQFLKKLNDFSPAGMSTEEISLLAAIDVMAEDIFLPIIEKANPKQ